MVGFIAVTLAPIFSTTEIGDLKMQRRLVSLRMLFCFLGLVMALPSHAFLDQLLAPLTSALSTAGSAKPSQEVQNQLTPQNSPSLQSLQTAACAGQKNLSAKAKEACKPPAPNAPIVPMILTRPVDKLDALFTGQEISGDQLLLEIKGLQSAIATQNLNKSMVMLMGGLTSQAGTSSAAGFSGTNFFSSLMSSATDVLLDSLVSELSYQSLNYFFSQMASKPGLLKDVSVTLPKADATMTADMKQQLVNMASFLVAIKASGKIIDAADQDFEAAKDSYKKVLEGRMAAAKLLGDAFYARAGLEKSQEESKSYLNPEQQEFLAAMRDKTPDDLMKNFAVQNMALEYFRKKDPAKYADYKAGVTEFKSHYGAYARTTVGAASMVGFSTLFLKKAKNMIEKNGLMAAPHLIGMVGSGLSETVSLVPRLTKVFNSSPDLQDGSFLVRAPDGKVLGELSASKTFSSLSETSRAAFQTALFKDGQLGYFGNFGEKFPDAGGRVLDALVQKENRTKLSKDYFEREEWPDFSFQNVLSGEGDSVDAKQLRQFKSDLFRSAPVLTATNPDQLAIAVVQQDVRDRLSKWDNSMLRRIILSNRSSTQVGVEVALSGYTVAVDSPGMKGIMEYEEMAVAGSDHAVTRQVASDRAVTKTEAKAPPKNQLKAKTKPKSEAK